MANSLVVNPFNTNTMFKSQSFDLSATNPATDLHKVSKKAKQLKLGSKVTGGVTRTLETASWLPLAAEELNISADIRDYVLVPVPAMITNLPNRNGDASKIADMLKWNPMQGRPAFKTFTGKPTFEEHVNADHRQAKGIIFDSYLAPIRGYSPDKYQRLMMLLGFDRTRDARIANTILNNAHNTFSMGMYFDSYTCSICGHTTHQETMKLCPHTKLDLPTYLDPATRKLVYRMVHNITGFECSYVGDPAFISAVSRYSHVMDLRNW